MHGAQRLPVAGRGTRNRDWWPDSLNLSILHCSTSRCPTPWTPTSTTLEAFKKLDYQALKKDLTDLMTDSQDWWPADYGHYGGLYDPHGLARRRHLPHRRRPRWRRHRQPALRTHQQLAGHRNRRVCRLLWPIKKYGNSISWADLFILV
ncbi:MAG: hypothetical protein R2810_03980 [Flavobacteriales bacterium]